MITQVLLNTVCFENLKDKKKKCNTVIQYSFIGKNRYFFLHINVFDGYFLISKLDENTLYVADFIAGI